MAIAVSRTGTDLALPKDHRLPGHTVDALLFAGEVAGARSELERLIDEGASEGDDGLAEMTPQYWVKMRTNARARDARKS